MDKEEKDRILAEEKETIERKLGMKLPKGVCICILDEHPDHPETKGRTGIVFTSDLTDEDRIKFQERWTCVFLPANNFTNDDIRGICTGDFIKGGE